MTDPARPDACPHCGAAEVVPLVFGMPDQSLMEEARAGEVALGGCLVEPDQPRFSCTGCGADLDLGEDGQAEVVRLARPWELGSRRPFDVVSGDLPIVVHVPHAALHVPPSVRRGMVLGDDALARELLAITDHLTDVLARPAVELGANAIINRRSRLVVDPERFPDPEAERMEVVGMGPVYTRTTDLHELRRPTARQRQHLLDRWFTPYADAMAALVGEVVDRHGRCTVVDVHSYPTRPLPYELWPRGPRPPLCIGTDEHHTPGRLADLVEEAANELAIPSARDTPFAGAYVPLDRYGTDERVTAVMLEVRRDQYLAVGDDPEDTPWGRWARPAPRGVARIQRLIASVVERIATTEL